MKAIIVEIVAIKSIENSQLKHVELSNGVKLVVGDHYEVGTPGIFIRDGVIVPDKLLVEMWLWNEQLNKGRLAGSMGNRVKSRKIAGIDSEGLFYGAYYFHGGQRIESPSWNTIWSIGDEVGDQIGIV